MFVGYLAVFMVKHTFEMYFVMLNGAANYITRHACPQLQAHTEEVMNQCIRQRYIPRCSVRRITY